MAERAQRRSLSTSTIMKGCAVAAIAAAAIAPRSAHAQASADAPPPPPAQPPTVVYQSQSNYYGQVPQSVAMSGPRRITDWQEGDPIPPGYHPVSRVRVGLVAGGAALFGALYLITVVSAAIAQDVGDGKSTALYAPIVGPFIIMPQTHSATANVFLAIDGIGQAAGIAMLIGGIAAPKTILIRNDLGFTLRPTPMSFGKSGNGFGFVGTF